jgi:hypothetical protein
MKQLWRTAIVTLLLTTGCSATGPESPPKLTLVTQPAPDGAPDLGPILASDYDDVELSNLADITPDEPFDSLSVVTAQVSDYGSNDPSVEFRVEASIGEPCKNASGEGCQTNFAKATTTQPDKWFDDSCGNCAEYTAQFLVVTKGDDVRSGLAELAVFGQIDTPTEVAWTSVSNRRTIPRVRKIDGGLEALETFALDECDPHITRMLVSRVKPDGTLVPVRFHDEWPDPDTGSSCP